MQSGEDMKPVSYFLSNKYKKMESELEKRRVQRMKDNKQYCFGGKPINQWKKQQLIDFAESNHIDIPRDSKQKPTMTRNQLKIYLILQLKHGMDKIKRRPLETISNDDDDSIHRCCHIVRLIQNMVLQAQCRV